MTTRSYHKSGGGGVVPAGIDITTAPAAHSPSHAFTDVLKQQQHLQDLRTQQRPISGNERNSYGDSSAPGQMDSDAYIRANSASNRHPSPASLNTAAGKHYAMSGGNGGSSSGAAGLVHGSTEDYRTNEEELEEDEQHNEDDVDDGVAELHNSANEPLDYCGVRLLPGVEQIDFDEGYYVGTIDENGEMAGYGKATWHTGDTYEGEWLDGMMHGKGTYTWTDGDYYRGDYVNGRMEGYGEMKDTTGLYHGEWVGDMRQGYGRMVYTGGNIYEGEWLAGMRHGPGKLIEVAANVTYEGEFNRNEKEGRGVQTNADGDVYEGEFANGKPNGRGTYLWSDGSRYIGMFKDGVKHGDGCEWLANGDWIAGMFQNGEHVDDNSTRHKAVQLSDDDGEGDGSSPDGAVGTGLSDEAAAAVLEPLDAEQLRRITEPVRRSSLSIRDSRRNSATASTVGVADAGAYASVRGGSGATAAAAAATASSVASPLTVALSAPQVILEDSELEGWTSLKTIGKGSFGAVYTALLRNGRTVCCKVIELGNVENEEEMEKLRNEIALMKRLHHPNCVQYYGSLEDKTKNTLNIFMEYVSGGTLTSFVNKFKSIPLTTLRQWAYQMVTGVKYLHDCGIVHRDIKGDNVLVSVDGIVKLADFGCSKSIDDVCSATHGCSTMVGTPYWMAPEVIKCEAGGYGMKSDIWSLGCTMVEMLTGKPPWPECNSMWAAVYKIANSTGLPTEIPSDVDPELMDLLEKCFERNPKLRPTAAELLKHPFLAKAAEGVSSPTASERQ